MITRSVFNSFNTDCKKFYKKEFDTAQGRTFGIATVGSPTSFKASILQFCVDALKHRLELSNGE
ncbi:conserved hypothetical protein [Treponema phagedenis]|uniref:Uncharacterized protein n=1 Tax=Treponema phagedenis TaxID=162 RepID=A0A0B7GXF5_TREPH|nr:conserved hypothetical protein [Treponema phagedenis]